MDELELVARLRADRPLPGRERLAPVRDRLLTSITVAERAGSARRRTTLVLRGAIAVAVAVAATLAAIGFRPATHALAPSISHRVSLARVVLRAAALSAASQPASEPTPGQWIYTKTVSYNIGSQPVVDEGWMTFDAGSEAYMQDGQLIVHREPTSTPTVGAGGLQAFDASATPLTAYEALASLPAEPAALLGAIDQVSSSIAGSGWDPAGGAPTRAQWEFGYLAQLLWNASQAAPAQAEAAVFRAMETIPGVTAERGVLDAAGRPAIALSIAGVSQQLLLDPSTYQVVGQRTVSDGTWPKNPQLARSPAWPAGTYLSGLAWERIAFVDRPGER